MRTLICAMLIGTLALVSCSKDETATPAASEEVNVSAVPSAIPVYVAENYPDATISLIYKLSDSDTVYSVILNTSELLAFDGSGKHLGHGKPGLYCDSIPGGDSTGFHHGGGHHGGGHHGGGHHGGGHHNFPGGIALDSIPASIAAYVETNYSGYELHHAWSDTLCQFGEVIKVMIDSSFSQHIRLVFTASGDFLATASRIKTNDLPQAIQDAIAANYATYITRRNAEVFTDAAGVITYKVFVFNQSSRLAVTFNAEGLELCTDSNF